MSSMSGMFFTDLMTSIAKPDTSPCRFCADHESYVQRYQCAMNDMGIKRKRLAGDSLDIEDEGDSLWRCFDAVTDSLLTVSSSATDHDEVTAIKLRNGSLEQQNMRLKAELYDAHYAGSSKKPKLQEEREHALATLTGKYDQAVEAMKHKHAQKLRSLKDLCALQQTQVTELTAHVALQEAKGRELTVQLALQCEEMRACEYQYRTTVAVSRSEKEDCLARIQNLEAQLSSQRSVAIPVPQHSTETACKLAAALQAVEDSFTEQHGNAWTGKLSRMAASNPDLTTAEVTLHTMVDICSEWLSGVETAQKDTSRTSLADVTAAANDAEPVGTLVTVEAGADNDGIANGSYVDGRVDLVLQRPLSGDDGTQLGGASTVEARCSLKQPPLSEYADAGDAMPVECATTNSDGSAVTAINSANDYGHGLSSYKSVYIGLCSHSDVTHSLLVEQATSLGQVISMAPCMYGWKVTFAASQAAEKAVGLKRWSTLLGAGAHCCPYRDTSVPVLQRCVAVTFANVPKQQPKAYKNRGDAVRTLARWASDVGDVLYAIRLGSVFYFELGDASTALTVQQCSVVEGMCIAPLEAAIGRIQLILGGYRTARAPIHFAEAMFEPDKHSLSSWLHDTFYTRAVSSAAAIQRRKAALGADAQFCSVELLLPTGDVDAKLWERWSGIAGAVQSVTCKESHRGGERRCAVVVYSDEASARAAVCMDWTLLSGEANPLECRPYRSRAVGVERRTLVITGPSLDSVLGYERLCFQDLRACGEIVDMVRLSENLYLVEFGKPVPEQARGALLEVLQQWRAGCDVVSLYQASAQALVLDVLGSDYHEIPAASSNGPNSDPVSTERYRWCRGWQFPHSVSEWLQRWWQALGAYTGMASI
jgi:uncharacterized coiled-coil protein SlyX